MYNGQTPIYVGCCHSTTAGNLSAVQQFFSGQIDEFFFIRGVALYTSNFEVPTTPFGGYIELKYIESTGVQYINTGFKSNQNTRFLGQISYYNVSSSTNAFSSKEAKKFCPEINSNNKLITYYGENNHTFEIDAEGIRILIQLVLVLFHDQRRIIAALRVPQLDPVDLQRQISFLCGCKVRLIADCKGFLHRHFRKRSNDSC